jgi:hypothetical protein
MCVSQVRYILLYRNLLSLLLAYSLFVYFRSEVKLYVGVIGPLRVQEPFALCEVHQVTVLIFCDVCRLEADEILELLIVLACDPASLVKRKRVEHHRGPVFVKEAVLNHFKLQFAHAADYFLITTELGE